MDPLRRFTVFDEVLSRGLSRIEAIGLTIARQGRLKINLLPSVQKIGYLYFGPPNHRSVSERNEGSSISLILQADFVHVDTDGYHYNIRPTNFPTLFYISSDSFSILVGRQEGPNTDASKTEPTVYFDYLEGHRNPLLSIEWMVDEEHGRYETVYPFPR